MRELFLNGATREVLAQTSLLLTAHQATCR